MSVAFLAGLLVQTLRISVPYLLAALGGLLCERSGVINIALEGLLLVGAFVGAVIARESTSALFGIAGGMAAGVALAAIYGMAVIRLRADQIVCGVAVTLLASGLTRFFLKLIYHSASNSPRIPALGSSLPLGASALVALLLVHGLLHHTRLGLRLRTAGEHPEAARAQGIAVAPLRWQGVLASGALAGLGGVWLAFDQHQFVAGMSAGRGYVALAAMILGGWRPFGAALGCLLFAGAEAIELQLQSSAGGLHLLAPGTVQAIPYIATLIALILRPRAAAAPQALGRPLDDSQD
ncbi:MAG TPA: ABC transporter permease [Polyangia bacterium]|jgi:simple sugar transport system permease protein|nr:ABC transporter permease [Polyangia bacterium]